MMWEWIKNPDNKTLKEKQDYEKATCIIDTTHSQYAK